MEKERFRGTVPIFVSAKMGLSLFPGDTAPMASLTQKFVQARFRRIRGHGVPDQFNCETYAYFIKSGLKIGTSK
jgi:hypothetical protein